MKTIIASLLLVMAAASAYATTDNASVGPDLKVSYGPDYVEACPMTPPETPAPSSGGCVEGNICPVGYEPVKKWCWEGWSSYDCGIQCKNSHLWDY